MVRKLMATLAEALETALQLHERGQFDKAETLYRQILARVPRQPEALHLLGLLHHQRGRHETAIDLVGQAIAAAPRVSGFHNSLGVAYRAIGRLDEAEASYRRALMLEPGFAEAIGNLGNVLHQRGDLVGAVACYRRALALDPRRAELHNNLGTALFDDGDLTAAEACYRRALELNSDYPEAHYHLGLLRLQLGDYPAGWREHEWRWRMRNFATPPRGVTQPQWRGEWLDGARILLHVEQGFGDMLQFVRYVPLVAARGGTVVLEAPQAMLRLFANVGGVAELVERGPQPPSCVWHCPLMSLPLAFHTTLATIPAAVPYIAVEETRAAPWRARLDAGGKPKVGLVLAGRKTWKTHYNRAVPAEALAALIGIPGIAFYSLQKDPPLTSGSVAITDLAPEFGDFADTAAAIAALDLVVSVDTAVAHLAGALGKPVWIMLPRHADWRWLVGRADSPWYPTAWLFRQTTPGDWAPVIADVVKALGAMPRL